MRPASACASLTPPLPRTHDNGSVQVRLAAARAAHHHSDAEPQLGGGGVRVGEHESGGVGLAVGAAAAVVAAHLLAKLVQMMGGKGRGELASRFQQAIQRSCAC